MPRGIKVDPVLGRVLRYDNGGESNLGQMAEPFGGTAVASGGQEPRRQFQI